MFLLKSEIDAARMLKCEDVGGITIS
jgi:hypothetical protein